MACVGRVGAGREGCLARRRGEPLAPAPGLEDGVEWFARRQAPTGETVVAAESTVRTYRCRACREELDECERRELVPFRGELKLQMRRRVSPVARCRTTMSTSWSSFSASTCRRMPTAKSSHHQPQGRRWKSVCLLHRWFGRTGWNAENPKCPASPRQSRFDQHASLPEGAKLTI